MIRNRAALARRAIIAAIRARQAAKTDTTVPISIFDFVENRGVEVRFEKGDSIEGLYAKEHGPVIVIGASRPRGRQAFTCAHEYGHHCFDHGTRLDEIDVESANDDPDEFLADSFAGYLLMPKLAVLRAFTERRWHPDEPDAEQAYVIAGVFGVG